MAPTGKSSDAVELVVGDRTVRLTHPDRVFTRTQLLDQVWGGNVYVEERTVDVHIRRLRKALEVPGGTDYAWLVQTIRGSGYRFSDRLHIHLFGNRPGV